MLFNSISKKNMLGYAIIFLVLLIFTFWLYGQMQSVHERNSTLIDNTLPTQAASEEVIQILNKMQLDAFRLYGTTLKHNAFKQQFNTHRSELNQSLKTLSALTPDAKQLIQQSDTFIDAINVLSNTMSTSSIDWDSARRELNTIQNHASRLSNGLTKLNEAIAKEAAERADLIDQQIVRIQGSVPIFLVVVSFIIVSAYFLSRLAIAKPIHNLSIALDAIVEEKDLRQDIAIKTNDEVGTATSSVNVLISAFRGGTLEIRGAAETLLSSVERLNDSASTGDENVAQLSGHLQNLLSTIDTLETSIEESAARSLTVSEAAETGARQVKSGAENVRKTSASVTELTANIEKSREELMELQNSGNQVSSVVKAIADIAEQTNLLALNAAIEAARAGESGRGFAVVADEVRTLASRTHESTHEINNILESIVSSISNTVEQMAINSERANATVELSETTVSSLAVIEQSVIELSNENQQLSEQAQVTRNDASAMRDRIDQIHHVTESVTESTRHTRDSSGQLADLASRLDQVSKIFKC